MKNVSRRLKRVSSVRENIDQELARLIYERWGNDLPAAAVAWRRLYQNNCSDSEFKKLVDGSEPSQRILSESQG